MLLFVPFLFFSCEKEKVELQVLGAHAEIIGTWVEERDDSLSTVYDGITRMNRREDLDPDDYGFIIQEDGTFLERKNAGWCGTPPITYENYEGNWEAVSDSLLNITVGYWGGMLSYQLQIVSLEEDKLWVRFLYSEDRIQ